MENEYEQNCIEAVGGKRPVIEWDNGEFFLGNLDIPARRCSFLYLLGLFFAAAIGGIGYFINAGSSERVAFIPLVISFFVVVTIYVLHKRASAPPRNWLTPDIFFVSVFCIFHFSYIVFYAFRLIPYDREVFWAPHQTLRAVFYCICCLCAFLAGYEIIGGRYQNKVSTQRLGPVPSLAIPIAKILIVIAIVFYWGVLFSVGLGRVISDYRFLTRIGFVKWGRLFWVSYNIALVGFAIYCAGSGLLNRKCMVGMLFPLLALGYVVGILLMGDRGGFIRFLPIPLLAFHYFQRRIKFRWLITGVLVLFFVTGVIGMTRAITVLNIPKVVKAYKERQPTEYNTITATALEYGASIKTVVIAMELVPSEHPYWYGRTYLESLRLIVPNVIPGIIRKSKGPDVWITETAFRSLYETHGRGGSIAMEAYMNFGFIGGILFFVFVGLCYRSIYERFLIRPDFMRTVLVLAATGVLVIWIRNTMDIGARTLVWSLLAAWIIKSLAQPVSYESYSEQELSYE